MGGGAIHRPSYFSPSIETHPQKEYLESMKLMRMSYSVAEQAAIVDIALKEVAHVAETTGPAGSQPRPLERRVGRPGPTRSC